MNTVKAKAQKSITLSELLKQYATNTMLRILVSGHSGSGKTSLINILASPNKTKIENDLSENVDKNSLYRYRYYNTINRKYILYDIHGSEQMPHQLVVGALFANLAILVVDSIRGVNKELRQQLYLLSLLRINHLLIAINLHDPEEYDSTCYQKIKSDIQSLAIQLELFDIRCIQICIRCNTNITENHTLLNWPAGPSLSELLDTFPAQSPYNYIDARLTVQYPVPQLDVEQNKTNIFAGYIASGTFHTGDRVMLLPNSTVSTIKKIYHDNRQIEEAFAPLNVIIQLSNYQDINRGCLLIKNNYFPLQNKIIPVLLIWLDETPLSHNTQYGIRHMTKYTTANIQPITHKIDTQTFTQVLTNENLCYGEIAQTYLQFEYPVYYDDFWRNRITGHLVIYRPENDDVCGLAIIKETI